MEYVARGGTPVVMDYDDILDLDDLSPDLLDELPPDKVVATSEQAATGVDSSSFLIGKSLKEIERWAIENSLKLTGGNREETANMLGISERNLYRKLKDYDLR